MPALSILMPVFNEVLTVEEAVRRVLDADFPVGDREILLIDDGSTDGTSEHLASTSWPDEVRVLKHSANAGKGAAVRTGLREARGTWTAIIDADLEYEPADTAELLIPLIEGEADAVFGSRGFQSHSAYSFWYVVGNKAVTLAANLLYNSWISDIMTGQKALRTDLFRSLPLHEEGFGIEPEITARLLRAGVRIYEVPVTYRARKREEGKKLTAVDGIRVIRTLVRCRVT